MGKVWADFLKTLRTRNVLPGRRRVPPPSRDAVAAFEARTAFRLPDSYRDFVLAFGQGDANDFTIFAPPDLEAFSGEFRDGLHQDSGWVRDGFSDPDLVLRLVVFAKNSNGDYAAWDPEDVRDPDQGEFAVYLLLNELDTASMLHSAAPSFAEFVMDCCYGLAFRKIVGDTSEDLPSLAFTPYSEML